MTHSELPGLPERYRLGDTLGTGGFGRVVRARDVVLDRDVAIKVMREPARDKAGRRRFRREAQVTARVRHPQVVAVYDSGLLSDGSPFMVYEFVPGRSLERATPGEVGPLLAVAAALADALAAIHAAGAVHRDVKPANVLMRRPGDPVLLDLGIVRLDVEGTPFTPEGILLGTPEYMAPELFGGGMASPASDQFAWAATLLHAAGGRVYQGGDLRAILGELKVFDPVARLPEGLPRGLRPVLAQALRADPADRYRDMATVGEELRQVMARSRSSSDERPLERTVLRGAAARRAATAPLVASSPTTRRQRGGRSTRGGLLAAIALVAVGVGYLLHRPVPLGAPVRSVPTREALTWPPPRLAPQLASLFPPEPFEGFPEPHTKAFLNRVYARAMDPSIPGGISRALRGVERWLAARTPAQRARPGGSVLLERELRPISRELAALIFIEERLRRGGVGSLFAQDSSFLDGWSREEVRHRYLVVRATVDASLCRMESVGAGPESFYPGLVMGLAKPLELLHGAGDTAACPGTEDRGARAFRRLIADLERVPESELARHARLAQDVSRVDLDFEVLSSAERAEGLDRIERELAARLRGASRRHELVEVLARRAGLIRDSPEADQEARLREARAALARLVEVVPEALGEIPALIDDDDRKVFSSPPAYDAFLEDVRAAVRQAAAG